MAKYASKNYDPRKAHEYYMRHRKLKGRQSSATTTAGMNQRGREAAYMVRQRINAQKTSKIASAKARVDAKAQQVKAALAGFKKEREKLSAEIRRDQQKINDEQNRINIRAEFIRNMSGGAAKDAALAALAKDRDKLNAQRGNLKAKRSAAQTKRAAMTQKASAMRQAVKAMRQELASFKKATTQEAKTQYTQELAAIRQDASMMSKKRRKR